jgi:hypothetical protein
MEPDQKMPGLNSDPQVNLGPNLHTYPNMYAFGTDPLVGQNFFAIRRVGKSCWPEHVEMTISGHKCFSINGWWPGGSPNKPIQKSVEPCLLHKRYVGTGVIPQETPYGYMYTYMFTFKYIYVWPLPFEKAVRDLSILYICISIILS